MKPVDIAKRLPPRPGSVRANVVLLDTAGRLHVDEVLMDELLRHQGKPSIRAKSCLWPMQ